MRHYFARHALLASGWADDVRIDVDTTGLIAAVSVGAAPDGAESLRGPVLPGLCDLHCHAFQRAMAGLAEQRRANDDTFWTWRELMYRFVQRIQPDDLEAIARQLYVELLAGGFTTVCEFHYLHHDPDGNPYADPDEMSQRIIAAAQAAGIGLTLLPVLYMTADFGGVPPLPVQRRFISTPERIVTTFDELTRAAQANPNVRLGIAPHSLRAVPPAALGECIRALDALDPHAPIHIHAAEQIKEVDECVAWSGQRPIEWLLDHQPLSTRWTVVHATHMTAAETERLARIGAVAGLCPTTEANLGDGLFPLGHFLRAGGAFGVGSDSNVSTSAIEELRWLEYGQRLAHRQRCIAATAQTPSVGRTLYDGAVCGGARAAGRPIAGIAPGQRADFVVLDRQSPTLQERTGDALLDALIFCGNATVVQDVFVAGAAVITDGAHADQERIRRDFRRAVARLLRD